MGAGWPLSSRSLPTCGATKGSTASLIVEEPKSISSGYFTASCTTWRNWPIAVRDMGQRSLFAVYCAPFTGSDTLSKASSRLLDPGSLTFGRQAFISELSNQPPSATRQTYLFDSPVRRLFLDHKGCIPVCVHRRSLRRKHLPYPGLLPPQFLPAEAKPVTLAISSLSDCCDSRG